MDNPRMRRLILCLRWFAIAALPLMMIEIAHTLAFGRSFSVELAGSALAFSRDELGETRWMVLVALQSASKLPWLVMIVQIEAIARLLAAGEAFSHRSALGFRRLSRAILCLAVLETLERPAIAAYLTLSGATPVLPDISVFDVVRINILLAVALFFVVARIVELGVSLKADADLTI